MEFDWSVPIGTVFLVVGQFAAGLVGILRAFAAIERSIDKRFSQMTLQLNTFEMGDLRELKASVKRLETGQDEWTKALRERTHDLANDVNTLKIKVDRLERPEGYHRRHDDPRQAEG